MRTNFRETSRRSTVAARRSYHRPAPPWRPSRARPLDSLGQARVEACLPLAYQLAWSYARQRARDVPPDELIAEALYGLTYAAGMFDRTRRVPFGAYATLVIRHRLAQCVQRWRQARRIGRYPGGTCGPDDSPWEAADHRPKPDVVAGASAREVCERVRRVLPAQWYAMLRLRYAEGWTFKEIGTHLGISRQAVQQAIEKATRLVHEHFPDGPQRPAGK